MTITDDHIRAVIDSGIVPGEPLEPATLAALLRARSARRQRARRRIRVLSIAGGFAAVVLLIAAGAATRDRTQPRVAGEAQPAPGSTAANPTGASAPLSPGGGAGYKSAPDLERSLDVASDDLVVLGEVRSVGAPRPAQITVPSGSAPQGALPSYEFSPVEVAVDHYLHAEPGVATPDPLHLRIAMVEEGPVVTPDRHGGTVTELRRVPLAEQLPEGSRILVFANAPRDFGDGLASTPSYIFHVTDSGVINERGEIVPMSHVTDKLTGRAPRRTPTSTP